MVCAPLCRHALGHPHAAAQRALEPACRAPAVRPRRRARPSPGGRRGRGAVAHLLPTHLQPRAAQSGPDAAAHAAQVLGQPARSRRHRRTGRHRRAAHHRHAGAARGRGGLRFGRYAIESRAACACPSSARGQFGCKSRRTPRLRPSACCWRHRTSIRIRIRIRIRASAHHVGRAPRRRADVRRLPAGRLRHAGRQRQRTGWCAAHAGRRAAGRPRRPGWPALRRPRGPVAGSGAGARRAGSRPALSDQRRAPLQA